MPLDVNKTTMADTSSPNSLSTGEINESVVSQGDSESTNRSRSSSRKRQLSKSSEEQMRPPPSRQRSLSQSRQSEKVTFKTQGQTFDMESVVETALMKPNVLKSVLPSIIHEVNAEFRAQLNNDLKTIITNAVSEAVESAVKPIQDAIKQQNGKIDDLNEKCEKLKAENVGLRKKLIEHESRINKFERAQADIDSLNEHLCNDDQTGRPGAVRQTYFVEVS